MQENQFESVDCKMAAILSWSQCDNVINGIAQWLMVQYD